MKRIISLLLTLIVLFASVCTAAAELIPPIEYTVTEDGVITEYFGEGYVNVPAVIGDTEIQKIGDKVFFDLGIEAVYMEEGIKEIGTSAFEGSNIRTADIPGSVHTIGKSAFMNCDSLSYIHIRSTDGNVLFKPDAFYNTPHISLNIYCTADAETLKEKFALAKGDDNFDIVVGHRGMADGIEQVGKAEFPISRCIDCGYFTLSFPGIMGHPFTDVDNAAWYAEAVDAAYNTGIINGKTENTFEPDATMTCSEAAKIAASIHALKNGNNVSKPESDAWYVPFVDYCYNYEIFEAHIAFDWNAPITRAQMAYMFSRADASCDYINDVPFIDIPDVEETTTFAYEILDLYDKGIAVGDKSMSFHPDDNIKRSEAAAIISRILFYDMRIELAKG